MRRFPLLAVLGILSMPALAADTARSRMEAFSSGLQSVTGRFSQTVTDANGRRGDASEGTFALQAPRQFRWETREPYQQTIVADGRDVAEACRLSHEQGARVFAQDGTLVASIAQEGMVRLPAL